MTSCVYANAAGVSIGDDEKLTSRYVGHVSRGSQQERLLLETAGSVEGLFIPPPLPQS